MQISLILSNIFNFKELDLHIREIQKKDIDSVYDLLKAYCDFNNVKLDSYTNYDLLKEVLPKETFVKLFVADLKGEIIGFILFNQSFDITGRALFIEDNFVVEKYRGKKIGSSLFSKVLEYALEKKLKKIKWSLKKRDAKYKSIYKEIGVKFLEDKKTYFLTKNALKKIAGKKIEFNSDLFKIREINNRDLPDIKYFIEEESEKLEGNENLIIDVYDLMKYGLGEKQLFKMLLLEVNGETVGLMTYFDYFSAFYGKASHIQHTFVKEDFKNIGIAKILNTYLINKMAKENYSILTIDIDSNDEVAKKRMDFFDANQVKDEIIVEMDNKALHNLINKR